jgi:hypothetical protein
MDTTRSAKRQSWTECIHGMGIREKCIVQVFRRERRDTRYGKSHNKVFSYCSSSCFLLPQDTQPCASWPGGRSMGSGVFGSCDDCLFPIRDNSIHAASHGHFRGFQHLGQDRIAMDGGPGWEMRRI